MNRPLHAASVAVLVAAPLALACGASNPPTADATCGTTCAGICVAGTCVPFVASVPSTWMVEITPPPGSTAALTEKPLSSGTTPITAAAAVTVPVSVDYATGVAPPTNADLVLTVPAVIPGRPDRTFLAAAVPGATSSVSGVPSTDLGRNATVTIAPLPPSDATTPPRTFPVTLPATLDPTMPLSVAVANTDRAIVGVLLEADSQPPANPFAARAFIAGTATPVSNQAAVSTAGTVSMVVPAAAAAMPLAVEIVATGGADPTFVSSIITFPTGSTAYSLGTILLPPYTSPNQFALAVGDEAQTPLAGAFVTATTMLSHAADGSGSSFTRSAVTSDTGVASLSLLPGTASTNLSYEIAVMPPAGSALGSTCRAAQAVGTGGTPTAALPLDPAIQLPHRRILLGTVRLAGGAGVPGVVVSATPGPGPLAGCTRTRAAPGMVTTDADGRYALPLDPGSYQLDYDPPADSPSARATNPNGAVTVTAAADPAGGDVTLPTAGLVQGQVNSPETATPLTGATVRVYEPQCSAGNCTAPLLRGQSQTDTSGRFRIVVASP